MILNERSTLRPVILGVMIGGLLGAVEVLTIRSPLPDELLTAAYAAVLILMSAPFLRSTRAGLICGIIALATQTALEFLYLASTYGIAIATGILPYTTLFLYRIVALPLAGALAGYLSKRIQKSI